jgi:serine protease AprX
MIKTSFLFLFMIIYSTIYGQVGENNYIIEFTDKNNVVYAIDKPEMFLSSRAIERRIKNNVIINERDLPVNNSYVQQVLNKGDFHFKYVSKWLNLLVLETTDTVALDSLQHLSFIKNIKQAKTSTNVLQHQKLALLEDGSNKKYAKSYHYPESFEQTSKINAHFFSEKNFYGKGVHIAVFDAGFNGTDTLTAFKHIYTENRLVVAEDFAEKTNKVYTAHPHGTWVLSTMAAVIPDKYIGISPQANYYLYRTENTNYEQLIEEYNWLAAAEHADSCGVDIISSSLGYTTFDNPIHNHNVSDLDGQTTIISQAATLAAEKGILVVSSAGNYGETTWRKIASPADAIGILTVGAIKMDSTIAPFSSVGYTADGRIKPDVVAPGSGMKVVTPGGNIILGNGTSFAAPIISASAACLMSFFPSKTSKEILYAIQQSAHLFQQPDSIFGYGIPDFIKASKYLINDNQAFIYFNEKINVYPNPFQKHIILSFLKLNNSGTLQIKIVDLLGKTIYTSENQYNEGLNNIVIEIPDNIKNGTYIVQINDGKEITSHKILKTDL